MLQKLQEEEKYQLITDFLDPYDKNLIVTPKDIDETIENLSIIISEGLRYMVFIQGELRNKEEF